MDTAVLDAPVISEIVQEEQDNGEVYAHWVDEDMALRSKLTGRPAIALCGKVWKPKLKAEDYPICPKCQEIYDEITQ